MSHYLIINNADAFPSKMRALPSTSRRGLCPRTPTLAVSNPCLYAGSASSVLDPCICQEAYAAYPHRPENRRFRYSTVFLTDPKGSPPSQFPMSNQFGYGTMSYCNFQISTVKEDVVQRCFILKQRIIFQRCFLLTQHVYRLGNSPNIGLSLLNMAIQSQMVYNVLKDGENICFGSFSLSKATLSSAFSLRTNGTLSS